MSKSEHYFYDHEAIKESGKTNGNDNGKRKNRRTVWNINTAGFNGAHFAVFPPELVRLCILAGSRKDSLVLDPFIGTGTVGVVARDLGRRCVGIEMKNEYADIARERIKIIQPGLPFSI